MEFLLIGPASGANSRLERMRRQQETHYLCIELIISNAWTSMVRRKSRERRGDDHVGAMG